MTGERAVPVRVCMTCGRRAFPPRLLCPSCGGGDWRREAAAAGVVEAVTALRRVPGRALDEPVLLATVRLTSGPRVVARLTTELAPGASVGLELDRGAIVARPY